MKINITIDLKSLEMPKPKARKSVLKSDDDDDDEDDDDDDDRFSDDYEVNDKVWNNDVNPKLYKRKYT